MKLSWVFLASTLAAASPVSYVDTQPTIWSEEAVTSMKQGIDAIYQINLGLYHKRTIFNGAPKCSAGAPSNSSRTTLTACSTADALLAAANNATFTRFLKFAEAMFPVYYGLPDNNRTPRASFSDFSHFYNYIMIEGTTFLNISAWYICKANLNNQTESARSFAIWFNGDDPTDVVAYGTSEEGNGTVNTYGSPDNPGTFINSFSLNFEKFNEAFEVVFTFFGWDKTEPSKETCADVLSKGLEKPIPPKDFPTGESS